LVPEKLQGFYETLLYHCCTLIPGPQKNLEAAKKPGGTENPRKLRDSDGLFRYDGKPIRLLLVYSVNEKPNSNQIIPL